LFVTYFSTQKKDYPQRNCDIIHTLDHVFILTLFITNFSTKKFIHKKL